MAERKQYRGGNIGLVNIPNIQTPQYTAQSQFFNDLNQRLDGITNFALKKGTEEAVEKAKLFAISNAPTTEQWKLSSKSDRSEFLGSGSNAYDQARKNQTLSIVANKLAISAINDITNINNNSIDLNGNLNKTPEEILEELEALKEGYTATLAQQSLLLN